jgi:aspartate/methionine/tyrosine aminotransferase
MAMNKGLPAKISALRAFNGLAGANTINLGLGKPYQDMPQELRRLAGSLLQKNELRQDYTENAGLKSARSKLEAAYGLPAESTILTHGAQEALYAALCALLNPGDEVLLPNPGFLAYGPMVSMMHGRPRFYALKKRGAEFFYDLDSILRGVGRRTKAVLLNAPGNPTGSTVTEDFVRDLAAALKKKKVILLSDEVYAELAYEGDYRPYCLLGKNIVSINAFSKSHALTGWRIGWLGCADPKLRNRLLVAHQYLSTCASVPAQHLVHALLSDEALFRGIRDGFRTEYLRKRDVLRQALGGAASQAALPGAGFYFFLQIPAGFKSSLAFAHKLLEKDDVLVIPGEFFGSAGKKFVRVSFSPPEEKLVAAGKAIAAYY